MKCDAEFKKRIRLKCYDAFERKGFTRFQKEGVDYPLGDGFNCWVGLNTGLYPDRVDIVPNVGLHVVPIERLAFEVEGGKIKYDRRVATYAINIGTLEEAGSQRAFAFSPIQSDGFITSECERLARIYFDVGVPFARSIATYKALAPLLAKNVGMLGGFPQRYAACLYLMGQKREARDFLLNYPERYRSYITDFAVPFIERIESEL